jgi:hypothetical protein
MEFDLTRDLANKFDPALSLPEKEFCAKKEVQDSLLLIVARFSSRSASRFFRSSRLSNCALPFPTASATFTFPFFQ